MKAGAECQEESMMTTEARRATDVVRAYFDALQQGQFDSLGALFADDVRWHQPGQGTLSGVYTGKAAVFELFGKFMQLSGGTFAIDQVETIMANGDFVAATLHFRARRATEQIAMNGVDVMRVRDGQIVEVWLFSADQRSEDAFWSRALSN
jgi:ketosteroid isomerase-like protein